MVIRPITSGFDERATVELQAAWRTMRSSGALLAVLPLAALPRIRVNGVSP